ncbi:MAG TPA: Ig-like domain-containing protein [Anaerolineae bacterium]|nr:Ig-like domain-containing protein [Anaerolineae bacterium]
MFFITQHKKELIFFLLINTLLLSFLIAQFTLPLSAQSPTSFLNPTTIIDNTSTTATNDGTITPTEYVGSSSGINGTANDVIGAGSSLYLDSDINGNLNIGLLTGGGSLDHFVVIYIDTLPGGFNSTNTLGDPTSPERAAATGIPLNPGPAADLTFAPGFEADYALVFNQTQASLFTLMPGNLPAPLILGYNGGNTAPIEIDGLTLANLGLIPGSSFTYIATYINIFNPSGAFRYNQFHGVDATTPLPNAPGHPGSTPVTLNAGDFNTFTSYANIPPTAVNNSYSSPEDTTFTANFITDDTGNGVDTDGGDGPSALQAVSVTNPAEGAFNFTPTGSFTYTPTLNYNGTLTFTYALTDGIDLSNTAVVTLTITAVNDPPVATNDTFTTTYNTPLTNNVITGAGLNLPDDDGGDGGSLSIASYTSPTTGTLSFVPDGTFTYTPTLNFAGTITFTYTITDGYHLSNSAQVTITVEPSTAPTAIDDSFSTPEDTPLANNVLTNDLGDTTTVTPTLTANPLNGSLLFNTDGSFTYTPTFNFNGSDSFTYALVTDTTSIPINILAYWPFDDATNPTSDLSGNGYNASLFDNTTFITDTPPNLTTGYALSFDGTDDRLEVSGIDLANQSFTVAFWAKRDRSGVVDLLVGQGTNSNSLGLHIGFRSNNLFTCAFWGNDLNTPSTYTDTTNWHHWACTYDATTNLRTIYVDGTAVVSATASADYQGSGTLSLGSRFNNTNNFDGAMDDVHIYLRDLSPSEINNIYQGIYVASTNQATVTIDVTPVNDPPVATDDSYTTPKNITLTVTEPGILSNDFDYESQPFTPTLVTTPISGSLELTTTGAFTYTPNIDACGPDSFTYNITDATPSISDTATVTITIPCSNAPIPVNDTYTTTEDTTLTVPLANNLLLNDYDPDGDVMTATLAASPTNGSVLVFEDGTFIYTPTLNFNGTDSFTYNAFGGGLSAVGTATINVTPTNDPPTAFPDTYSLPINSTFIVATPGVLDNDTDIDSATLIATLTTPPTNGLLTLNNDGSFIYTPTTAFTGTDSFTYYASDSNLSASNVTTATLTVIPAANYPTCFDFESGALPSTAYAYTTSNNGANGRVQVNTANPYSGNYALQLDTDCNGCGSNTLQAAIFVLDLASASNIALDFWIQEFGDENNTEDGLFISDDGGQNWVQILSFNNFAQTYTNIQLDLDTATTNAGLSYTDNFLLKFQAYDNYSIATDGYAIDDICLEPLSSEIDITPTAFTPSLYRDSALTQTLNITNNGLLTLTWQLDEATTTCASPDDVSWLTVAPITGTNTTNTNTNVNVIFDAIGLSPNTYTSYLCATSNDIANPLITIPITMTVLPLPGELEANPLALDVTVGLSQTVTVPLTITNIGETDAEIQYLEQLLDSLITTTLTSPDPKQLTFAANSDHAPQTNTPWAASYTPSFLIGDYLFDVNLTIPTSHVLLLGLEYDFDYYWATSGGAATNSEDNYLFQFDTDGELINSWPQGTTSVWGWRDLASDGTYLYGSDSAVVTQIDPATGAATGLTIPCPLDPCRALAYDPATDHFWTSGFGEDIYEFDRTGTVINQHASTLDSYGAAWDNNTTDGPYLWIWSQDGATNLLASQFDPSTGTFTGVTFNGTTTINGIAGGADITYQHPDYLGMGVFLGLHQADTADFIVAYDLDTLTQVPWLSATPTAATVAANNNHQTLYITFDATVSATITQTGIYSANIIIANNTPYGSLVIPITMTVTNTCTPPSTPTDLTLTPTPTDLTLTWTDTGTGADNYLIHYISNAPYTTPNTLIGHGQTNFTHTNILTAGTLHTYTITPQNCALGTPSSTKGAFTYNLTPGT